ncbi:MAG TPA: hypothetical protein VG604_03830 [Candidatus Saccharimonadales bacterium]|nr:hypothetical protein [Candidatus Saccharimonadales bacterium]
MSNSAIQYESEDAMPIAVVDAAMESFGSDDPRLLLDAVTHAPELKLIGTLRAIEEIDKRVGLSDADALKRQKIIDGSARYLQKTHPVLLSTLYRHVPYIPYDPPRPERHHYDD